MEEGLEEFYKENSKEDSKEDFKEDNKEDSEEDLKEDNKEDTKEIDELSDLVKKHLYISKELKGIKDDKVIVKRAKELAENNLDDTVNYNSDEEYLNKHFPEDWSYDYIMDHLEEEEERLKEGKKEYVSEISQARESKGDTMEVDSPTGNKRKESSTEDTNSSKRQKSSNNDESSGSSGPSAPSAPSAPFGPSSSSNEPDVGNPESGGNNASKKEKFIVIIGSILEGLPECLSDIINFFL